jgi:succinate dehydrogenase / fumarate reductase iron-sulfur subunit
MDNETWHITLKVYRQKEGEPVHFDSFRLSVDPDEYILDAVERIWAFHDRSLCYRHACHHSVCGACAMRVNGVEKLTCITLVREVTRDGGEVTVEPLRNFPVISDLVVDMGQFYRQMEQACYPQVAPVNSAPLAKGIRPAVEDVDPGLLRLNDCIECGCCISACPVAATTDRYLGPAVLAGVQASGIPNHPELIDWVDHQDGAWRCHSVFECSAVCPSFVEPGWRIMDLRKQVVTRRFRQFLSGRKEKGA